MDFKYNFKKNPFDHQRDALEEGLLRPEFGYFMEMGTGKSKVLIDNMGMLYLRHDIDFALVIAPKGVYRNWVEKEIPEHMSDNVYYRVIRWVAGGNKKQQEEMRAVQEPFEGLTIFVMNVEAFSSLKGRTAGEWFSKRYGSRGMIAVDESTTIKNPKAKRTKALLKIAQNFRYRRLLTGSPVTKSPMDIWAQAEFLRSGLMGFEMGATAFTQILGYKNIDELTDRIDSFSFRVLKKDCLDLPEKIYTYRNVSMTPEQRRMYEGLRTNAMVMFEDGEMTTAPAVITQLLRMQQVMSGHLKTDEGEMLTFPSTRLDALLEIIEEHQGKAIIWSRFRHDIQTITEALNKRFGEGCAAAYFGDTSDDKRSQIVKDFQNGDRLRFFVGNPATAGYGLTLTEANLVVYYANDFNLETRIQSEDRAHRIGQHNPVTYVDLITEKTIDEKIVKALRNKINIGAAVLGEQAREWLTV